MSKIMDAHKKIEQGVVSGYKKIEDGVVGGYKKIEDGVVSGYKKIEGKIVGAFQSENKEVEVGENPLTKKSFQDQIRDRLQTGFGNWNNGYESWLNWCNTLYEPDAHYNVYGKRLTLQQYKDMMGQFFAAFDVRLGDFFNMLVEDDWCAIRYSVYIKNKQTGEEIENMTMEFVNFKNNPEPIGARVIEGWALSDKPLA